MSKTIKDRFANFLDEIEQMEKDNETLTEDLERLEKEKKEGYKKFNTETHTLLEKEKLKELKWSLEEAYSNCESVASDAESLESQASDVYNTAAYARDEICGAERMLTKLLISNETSEEGETE